MTMIQFTSAYSQNRDLSKIQEIPATPLIEVISSIRLAKESQAEWSKIYFKHRVDLVQAIKSWLVENADRIALHEAEYQGLTKAFVAEHAVHALITYSDKVLDSLKNETHELEKNPVAIPMGVVAIITGWQLQLRTVLERLIPCLLAGNVAIVKVSSRCPSTGLLLQDLRNEILKIPELAQLQGLFQVLCGREAREILVNHPGVTSVSFLGHSKNFQKIILATAPLLKPLQMAGSAKNCALLGKDFDPDLHGEKFLQSLFMGNGTLAWSTSRVLALESERERIIEFFRYSMSRIEQADSPESQSTWTPGLGGGHSVAEKENRGGLEKNLNSGISEGGFIIGRTQGQLSLNSPSTKQQNWVFEAQSKGSAFIAVDVSQCSVMQQDPLDQALALVNFVKYPFEMAKWVNNGYLSFGVSVWGGEEFFQKISPLLDVSFVRHNSWMPGFSPRILGGKNSVYGRLSLEPTGDFYSQVKNLADG